MSLGIRLDDIGKMPVTRVALLVEAAEKLRARERLESANDMYATIASVISEEGRNLYLELTGDLAALVKDGFRGRRKKRT